jgi:glycosyltransferase involved in cell wall biosynthesis
MALFESEANPDAGSSETGCAAHRRRLLVFIVAYHAESTIDAVLDRVPHHLTHDFDVEVLIIDDASTDATFSRADTSRQVGDRVFPVHVLHNPVNLGYGGNQKVGYYYAIANCFDIVALVHGDGQYAPECLADLVQPIARGEADAVFGSRMLEPRAALKGGMPLYKYVGNKVLTFGQNALLGTSLSEFHSGYRLYSVNALKKVPFNLNTNDFHFDTEIIIQLVFAKFRIKEMPIPTYYGTEICRVNGIKYAANVMVQTVLARSQSFRIWFDAKYDVGEEDDIAGNDHYRPKLTYSSPHKFAVDAIPPGARVLDVGCGRGYIADALKKKGCSVAGVDKFALAPEIVLDNFIRWELDLGFPHVRLEDYDYVLLLDVIEHLDNPERFVAELAERAGSAPHVTIIASTGNVAFLPMRINLLFGKFNYGKRGILDRTHKRLFTFSTFRSLFQRSGFVTVARKGTPPPFPLVLGDGKVAQVLLAISSLMIGFARSLFSFQIIFVFKPRPSLRYLLDAAIDAAMKKREAVPAAQIDSGAGERRVDSVGPLQETEPSQILNLAARGTSPGQ